jgi:hypothetical protein
MDVDGKENTWMQMGGENTWMQMGGENIPLVKRVFSETTWSNANAQGHSK